MSFSSNVIGQNATNLQYRAFGLKLPDHILSKQNGGRKWDGNVTSMLNSVFISHFTLLRRKQ